MPIDSGYTVVFRFNLNMGLRLMVLRISKILGVVAFGALLQLALLSGASADERITEDYIALVFEAEGDDTRAERWVLMNSSTPEQDNDPDGNHSDGAVGGAYIELLPDMRVTSEDTFGPPTAIWHEPGDGPEAEYTMNFPEAGRYYVHIRAYSTGTEDNGIHVGIDNDWPMSGRRMQFCTAGQGWQWSGRQRNSGGAGPCGAKKTIWITVDEPGDHTFKITPREDGFEADRIMLIKDLSGNTRICSPSGSDDITCVDGSLENIDEVADMAVSMTVDQTEIDFGSSVVVSIVVRNDDGYDSASNVELRIAEGIRSQWNPVDLPENCDIDGTSLSCDLGTVTPSWAGEEGNTEIEITLESLQAGVFEIPVSISTSSVDGSQSNDTANLSVTVTDTGGELSSLSLQFEDANLTWQSNVETRVAAVASNSGPADAANVGLSISVPAGLTLSSLPAECTGTTEVQCNYQTIEADDQVSVDLGITPVAAGLYSLSVTANAGNLNGDAITSSIIVDVVEANAGNESENGTNAPVTGGSKGGALVWWTLMLLTFALYMRQIHASRVGRRTRLTISGHVS